MKDSQLSPQSLHGKVGSAALDSVSEDFDSESPDSPRIVRMGE